MKESYLSVTQAATRKGVSRTAIYLALKDGRLASVEIAGRNVLRETEVDAWTPMTAQRRRGVRIGGLPTPPGKTPRRNKEKEGSTP
jgi:excisionase family DNA binding protein